MNQNRDVETRTAQLDVCSLAMVVVVKVMMSEQSREVRGISFMLNGEWSNKVVWYSTLRL